MRTDHPDGQGGGRQAGLFASAAPPVRLSQRLRHRYARGNELIAHGRSVEQVREEIGADWLVYQDLEDLIECSREGNPEVDGFESSVFDGRYQAGDIDEQYLQSIEAARADGAKGRGLSWGPAMARSSGYITTARHDSG